MMICAPFAKVAELRLPDHQQHRGPLQAVAVFEAEHGILRQRAVVHGEASLVRRKARQRDAPRAGRHVRDREVPVREGAARHVLAGEADIHAILQQRAERQRLGGRPGDQRRGADLALSAVYGRASDAP